MKKKHLIIISYIIFIMFAIISSYNVVNADLSGTIWGEAGRLANAGSMIVGFIQWGRFNGINWSCNCKRYKIC